MIHLPARCARASLFSKLCGTLSENQSSLNAEHAQQLGFQRSLRAFQDQHGVELASGPHDARHGADEETAADHLDISQSLFGLRSHRIVRRSIDSAAMIEEKQADPMLAIPDEAGEKIAHRMKAVSARLDRHHVLHDAGRRLLEALGVQIGAQPGRVVVAPWPRLEGWNCAGIGHVRDRPAQHDGLGEFVEGHEAGQVGVFAQFAQDVGVVAKLLVAAHDMQAGGTLRLYCHVASLPVGDAVEDLPQFALGKRRLRSDGVPCAQEVTRRS